MMHWRRFISCYKHTTVGQDMGGEAARGCVGTRCTFCSTLQWTYNCKKVCLLVFYKARQQSCCVTVLITAKVPWQSAGALPPFGLSGPKCPEAFLEAEVDGGTQPGSAEASGAGGDPAKGRQNQWAGPSSRSSRWASLQRNHEALLVFPWSFPRSSDLLGMPTQTPSVASITVGIRSTPRTWASGAHPTRRLPFPQLPHPSLSPSMFFSSLDTPNSSYLLFPGLGMVTPIFGLWEFIIQVLNATSLVSPS